MNKLVIITGGTRGIGSAVTRRFAKEGYDVIATVISESENSKDFVKEIESEYNVNVYDFVLDVSKSESVENFIKEFKTLDRKVDALVNNAGITNDKLTSRMTEDDFMKVIDINLKGTFLMSKHILKIMSKQKFGSIVNISSVVGVYGNLGQANYSASKAGVIGLTKSHAKEFGRKNIRVNAVAPGFIKTQMTDFMDDKMREDVIGATDLKRLGTPEEVANLCYFLGSDQSEYITGQTIIIDGGMV